MSLFALIYAEFATPHETTKAILEHRIWETKLSDTNYRRIQMTENIAVPLSQRTI